MRKVLHIVSILLLSIICSCSKNENGSPQSEIKSVTLFFVNDQHGQINNFSKIKHIIDAEREETNVIVACSGDMFSGNPIVDNATEEGAPMIELMNSIGFDVSVIGNHEFDYGNTVLKKRMEQANFEWVCANVDMSESIIPQSNPFVTIKVDDVKLCFLGLIETNGKEGATIPSTHPNKVIDLKFQNHINIVNQYASLKTEEDCDLLIALTHIGYNSDVQLAQNYSFFDVIIGGHSHSQTNEVINNTPIYQSGSYLRNLGKIEMQIKDKKIEAIDFQLIDLESYEFFDNEIQVLIDSYNDQSHLKEVIGFSHQDHGKSQVGCFYTDALREGLGVDATFQNTGGVRSGLYYGDITKREIYEISPFKNGILIYEMTVSEIKKFLRGTGSGFYFSGIRIEQEGQGINIKDMSGNTLSDNMKLRVGINDYIPAVHDAYFPKYGVKQPLTAAETLIAFLSNGDGHVNYQSCNRYFKFQ